MSRSALPLTALSLSLLGAPFLTACPASEGPGFRGEAGEPDAGEVADAGSASDAAAGDAPIHATASGEADNDPNFASCFNGMDENGMGGVDCADSACELSPPCCIGLTNARCCAGAPVSHTLSIETCSDLTTCTDLRVVEGFPEIAAGRLTMVSSRDADCIVDFPSWTVTPQAERVVMRAAVSVSTSSTLPIDAIAFGIWPGNTSAASVNPDVGVVISATRQDVSILVGSRIVSTRALAAGVTSYALTIEPDGHVSLLPYRLEEAVVGQEQNVEVTLPRGTFSPVVFGRVTNNEDGAASLSSLVVERFACDIPAAISTGSALTFQDASAFDITSVSDPSVAIDGTTTRIAFAARATTDNTKRTLFVGTLIGNEVRDVTSIATADDLTAWGAITDLAGPSLVVRGGHVDMYFAYRESEAWKIGLVRDALATREMHAVMTPAGSSYDDPTWLGEDALLVRELGERTRFVRLNGSADSSSFAAASVCGADSSCASGAASSDYVLQNSGEALAFDRDEIRSPVVVKTEATTRVYYAGRRGTRWSIGMLQSSGNGLYFRASNEGNALLTGSGSGLDALSVSSPTAWIEGSTLHLVYAGSDGVSWTLFHTAQPINAR